MRIERFYSSVKEEASPLSDDAATLLEAEDYVGFFKACGPNYTRGIRRAQEITAVFKFSASSREVATQFSSALKVTSVVGRGVDASLNASSKFKQSTQSLQIKIQGFGLGLNQDGSETLVATSMSQYTEVMKFAFNTMTKAEGAHQIGMIYGIEVVPWVNNVAFQAAAKLQDENIVIPLPRTLIPKAYKISDGSTTGFDNSSNRADFTCKDSSYQIDQFGYCCEPEALFDRTTKEYDLENPETKICKPVRSLDRSLVKDNMSNNGEFVARMGSAIRYKMTQISSTEKCISAANSFPAKYEFNMLKSLDTVKYDKSIEFTFSLFELKTALDPFGDYNLITQMGRELEEWIEMFYSPCFAALYGTNVGTTPETDVSFFMAYPWFSHPECMHLPCLLNNFRWDRKDGGCIPGILAGAGSDSYEDGEDDHCASDLDANEDTETCRFLQSDMKKVHSGFTNCWSSTTKIGTGPVTYIMEHFCNPQITGDKIPESDRQQMRDDKEENCPVPS